MSPIHILSIKIVKPQLTFFEEKKISLVQNTISMIYNPLCMLIILLHWKILLCEYFFDNPSKVYICHLELSSKIKILNYVCTEFLNQRLNFQNIIS